MRISLGDVTLWFDVSGLPIAEDLTRHLPADTTRLVRLPGARHTIFRDRPDLAFPAVEDFIRRINNTEPALAGALLAGGGLRAG